MTEDSDNLGPATRRQQFMLKVFGFTSEQTAGLTKRQASGLLRAAERAGREAAYARSAGRKRDQSGVNWVDRLNERQWEAHDRKWEERRRKWQDPPQDADPKSQ